MAWLRHGVCELEAREYVSPARLRCTQYHTHATRPDVFSHNTPEEYVWVLCVTVRELEAIGE